jgi:hypothetical protein
MPSGSSVALVRRSTMQQIPYIHIIQCHDIEFGSLDQVGTAADSHGACCGTQQPQEQQLRHAFTWQIPSKVTPVCMLRQPLPFKLRDVCLCRSSVRRCLRCTSSKCRAWCILKSAAEHRRCPAVLPILLCRSSRRRCLHCSSSMHKAWCILTSAAEH